MRVRIGAGVVVALSLGARAGAFAGPGGFTFTPPPGWIDISRGVPEEQRRRAPPSLLAQMDGQNVSYAAIDSENWDDGFIENMNAVVSTGKRPPPVTPELLAFVAKGLEEEAIKRGMSYRALKVQVVKVAGVTGGRIVGEMIGPGIEPGTILQYSIPGKLSHATLTFTTTSANFARYEPLFEASAQATAGAVEARTRWQAITDGIGRDAIVGAVAGGIAAFLVALAKRKRRATTAPPDTGSGHLG